jgi:hypothetical protein
MCRPKDVPDTNQFGEREEGFEPIARSDQNMGFYCLPCDPTPNPNLDSILCLIAPTTIGEWCLTGKPTFTKGLREGFGGSPKVTKGHRRFHQSPWNVIEHRLSEQLWTAGGRPSSIA